MKIKYLLVVGLVLCSAQVQALAKGRGINSQPVVRVVIPHFHKKKLVKGIPWHNTNVQGLVGEEIISPYVGNDPLKYQTYMPPHGR